jgi:histidine ammonia-lyase
MILLDGATLTPDLLHEIALGSRVQIHPNSAWAMRVNAESTPEGSNILAKKRRWLIGDHADGMADNDLAKAFILGHCTGVGDPLPAAVVRAAIAARVNVFAQGISGCRAAAAGVLLAMLNNNVTPTVPAQGSVGAAGDLAPMAHIAAVACGYLDPNPKLPDFAPTPKEALALINGVSLTTALAAIAVVRTRRVLESAIIAAAMTMEVVCADTRCIDARSLEHGHAGARLIGRRLREQLEGSTLAASHRNPDAFSIRCTPQVMGAVWRTLSFATVEVKNELNAVSDNPLLIDGTWLEAGNFHGASVAMAMDHLKVALAQLATLSERRTFRLTHGKLSKGLPSFLVAGTGLNSGFMLAQYTAASLASECKTLSHPASVDTIPTVQHHEDHVSMGPIAARQALRMVECVADIVGIELMLAAQGLDLRRKDGDPLAPKIAAHLATVRGSINFWEDDQVMHPDIAASGQLVRTAAMLGDGSARGW